ncbi:acyl-CoA/acyl-ACP dehydrogenase [Actinomycetospora endophytica]|uniref:Acyl-CoA/acyl-ACP dehydrogenase n=1 Tax=Actinomycetospora endophytica TaxID=2291215 RepID=A0ABS8PAQ8_9PSEU|nr:acyl-CoA dehydrogenase family protein [Actinomycetospora endophytica]MCD2195318.1 acyl-CoA/acyl-ACP dehydrogenase [Actinomycetospora endophytica]
MQLVPTSEQDELRSAVRALLDKQAPRAVRATVDDGAGYDRDLWRRLGTELGVLGLAVPEELGGAGAGHVERAILAEELGRALLPSPFLGSAVLATDLLVGLDDRSGLLGALGSGERMAAVAGVLGPAGDVSVSGGGLRGSAGPVVDATDADDLLVVVDGVVHHLDATGPGVVRTPLRSLDPTRRHARVDLDGAAATRLGSLDSDALQRVRDLATVAIAAEQTGVMGAAVDRTVAYVSDRVQFGRVIGSYQAVKHGCADMYASTEQAVSAVRAAAWAADHDPDALPLPAAVARVFVGPAAFAVTNSMVQYHGGIGYTWEHDAHLFYKRAKSDELLSGPPGAARARLAELMKV